MSHHKHSMDTRETGDINELDCLYPAHDPRRRVIANIDFHSIAYKSQAAAILDSLRDNPGRYEGDELWDPPSKWMRDVHFYIANELKLKDWKNLRIIPTLKTAADRYHGIDFLVIYQDPLSDREVILSVDITLRDKEDFKADVLVTRTSAIPNIEYYHTGAQHVADINDETKEQYNANLQRRRHMIGQVIADVIEEKLRGEDPHYRRAMKEISDELHNEVLLLLNSAA